MKRPATMSVPSVPSVPSGAASLLLHLLLRQAQDQLAVVQRTYEAVGQGDIPALLEQVTDDMSACLYPQGRQDRQLSAL